MRRHSLHNRLFFLSVLAGLPAVVVALTLIHGSDLRSLSRQLLIFIVGATWLGLSLVVRSATGFHLRTLSNLLAALREGDYSFRVRGGRRNDPFGEVVIELNALTETLRRQRVDDLEATALLRKVMAEIDVAVFAFDHRRTLRLVNAAGERLLAGRAGELHGQSASELGLDGCLDGEPARTMALSTAGGEGRWEMRRGKFRQQGMPHHLLVLSDVSRALRAEELAAWKRLIRVIGHELNNSLAPIKSLAGSLERLTLADPLPEDWRADLHRGLRVIASRAEALHRVMGAASKLAKMPEPNMGSIRVAPCVRRVLALETRLEVVLEGGPGITLQADQDQLEQVLINLVRNAVDASIRTSGSVDVGWMLSDGWIDLRIRDQGHGLPETANLFVPFFTTKPGGSGIGLFLCRQIVEAHGGSVTLANRADRRGCEAHVLLPRAHRNDELPAGDLF